MNKPKNKSYHILAVDDSPDMLELIRRNLSPKGFIVITVSTVLDAIKILESTKIDLVITDLQMPQINGMELLKHVRENYKNTGTLVITGYPSISNAVETVKLGANEYLIKSFTKEELFDAVNRTLKTVSNRKQLKHLDELPTEISGIIGNSPNMKKMFHTITKAASLRTTILLNGETGTGKELIARAIHYGSKEASAPFIVVNCGGIPENLLESELFGFLKGSFTGAHESRGGFFQAADGGSIFLDEIHNTSLAMQAKLLRVLQEKEVIMIGSNKAQKINVRIIAAANVDLMSLVKKGTFREDLYYRLNIIPVMIPPLREREGDINLLTQHFIDKYSSEMGANKAIFTDKLMDTINSYDWPGNVRELENIVQRLIVLCDGVEVDVTDLPQMMRYSVKQGHDTKKSLKQIEMEHIQRVLADNHGNKSKAAEILGIDRKTLREKLKS